VAFTFVAYAFLATMTGTTLPTPLYPIYESRMDFSGLIVTLVFATYAVGVIVGLLVFGRLSDQVGRRGVLLPGLVAALVSSMIFLFATGVGALFAGRLVSGLSAGTFTGTATATLLDLAPPHRRSRAGLIAAAVNLGGLGLGPLLAGILAQYAPAPLRLSYLVHAVLLVPALIGVWRISEPGQREGVPQRWRLRVQRLRVPEQVRGTFVRASIAGFAGFAVLGLFTSVSPLFLEQVLHEENRALVGLVVFSLLLASTVGQGIAGTLTERLALLAGCLTLAVGVCIVAVSLGAASLELLVVGAIVAGLGQGAGFRAGLVAIGSQSPAEDRGAVSSSFFLVVYVALSLPVIGVGAAAERFGLVPAGVVFSVGVAVLALVAFASLLRHA
jgi:MFS family permease